MKKFYSILAIAFMCMVGEMKADNVTFSAANHDPLTQTVSGITFSLENFSEAKNVTNGETFISGYTTVYVVDKQESKNVNTMAYITWNVPEEMEGKQIVVNSITYSGRCKRTVGAITKHSLDSWSSYTSEEKHVGVFSNDWGSGFGWETTTIEGSVYFQENGLTNNAKIYLSNGGGDAQFTEISIDFEVVEEKTVSVNANHEVTFVGAWDANEINEIIKNTLSYSEVVDNTTVSVPVPAGQFGVIDLTAVTGNLATRQPIMTVNPNTIIARTSEQPSVRPTNELVYDGQDSYVENLVVVDPSLGTDTQSGFNYDEVDCGWYCTRSFTAKKASYTRPMGYSYGTVVLPFAYDVAGQSHQIEEITEVADETITSKRVEVEGIRPCQPVIVWSATPTDVVITAEDTYVTSAQGREVSTLIGTLTETTIGAGQYFIAKDKFWSAEDYGEIIVKPFRAWFEGATEMAVKSFSINGESATAIKNVESATAAAPAYNLQGVRVAPNAKGFVIINGKKTYNK